MNRRGFLKRASALAVAGAFPLPTQAATEPFKLDAEFVQAFSRNAAFIFMKKGDVFVAEHEFDAESWVCTRCNHTAEHIVETDVACI